MLKRTLSLGLLAATALIASPALADTNTQVAGQNMNQVGIAEGPFGSVTNAGQQAIGQNAVNSDYSTYPTYGGYGYYPVPTAPDTNVQAANQNLGQMGVAGPYSNVTNAGQQTIGQDAVNSGIDYGYPSYPSYPSYPVPYGY